MVSNAWGGVILPSVKSSRFRSLHNIFNSASLGSGYKFSFQKLGTLSHYHLAALSADMEIIFLFVTAFTYRKMWVLQDEVPPLADIFQVLLFALFQTMSKLTEISPIYSSRTIFISTTDNIRVENYVLYSTGGTYINAWQYENCRFWKLVMFFT